MDMLERKQEPEPDMLERKQEPEPDMLEHKQEPELDMVLMCGTSMCCNSVEHKHCALSLSRTGYSLIAYSIPF